MACFGIGGGKTFVAAEWVIPRIAQGAEIIVTAGSYSQLKQVLFREIQTHLRLHGIPFEVNKSDMIIDVPMTGARVYGFSTSSTSIENARGYTVDCLVMDECALADQYAFDLLSGRCRRNSGIPRQKLLITTPRGKNNFVYDLVQKPNVQLLQQSTFDNPFLPRDFLEDIKEQYQGDFARQELMGEFVDSDGFDQLISVGDMREAQERIPTQSDEPLIFGLDVARYGGDNSILISRRGNESYIVGKWNGLSLTDLSRVVCDKVVELGPDSIVIDGVGVGGGAVDILKEKLQGNCNVIEFNGATRASDPMKYSNLRAETWFRMRNWIRRDGSIEKEKIVEDITTINYFIDGTGRQALESKEHMKRRGHKSPDFGDGLSMTFIDVVGRHNIKKKSFRKRKVFAG